MIKRTVKNSIHSNFNKMQITNRYIEFHKKKVIVINFLLQQKKSNFVTDLCKISLENYYFFLFISYSKCYICDLNFYTV